jgi:hypothetical protein
MLRLTCAISPESAVDAGGRSGGARAVRRRTNPEAARAAAAGPGPPSPAGRRLKTRPHGLKQKTPDYFRSQAFLAPTFAGAEKRPLGNDLLSQAVSHQVPSALASLTSGFGMGPGVPSPHKSPRDDFYTVGQLNTRIEICASKPQVLRITLVELSPRSLVRLRSLLAKHTRGRLSSR